MFVLLAQADGIECLVQFAMVALFLLLSLVSWAIKQFGAAGQKRAAQRRAAEQRRPAQQRGRSWEPSGRAPIGETAVEREPPFKFDRTGAGEPADVYEAEVIEAAGHRRLGSKLSSDHLADHASHLSHLEHDSQDDFQHKTPEEVHELFDHQLGTLGDSGDAIHEDPDADKIPDAAVTSAEIADIFRHPHRVREAIILHEILTRPDEREL